MPSGGVINFYTENTIVNRDHSINGERIPNGNYVKISIEDSGTGMSKIVKNKIFEPFFTTKAEGKGTGLGLATVYGIVNNHKGHISVSSEVGKGTLFSILFPSTNKKIKKPVPKIDIVAGNSTILFVDDEKDLRNLAKKMLENLGYKVITAIDGNDALQKYKENKANIDLTLLDMIMPNKSGKETFYEIKKINPKAKILLSSGYSIDDVASKILKDGAVGFLPKPFKLNDLSAILNKILK